MKQTKTAMAVKAANVDLGSSTLVECLQRRPGGTQVPFGFHARKQEVYEFLPLDPEDPESPHIADVPDEDHYERLLSIKEGYRAYDPDDYETAYGIPAPADDEDDFDPRNDADDLLSVDPQTVSNEWLGKFAKEVLKTTSKQSLYDHAVQAYSLEIDYASTTANEITRQILIKRIEEEKRGNE